MTHGLGRHRDPDPRDEAFPMQAVLAAPEPDLTSRYWYANGLWADQGATGTCVGHAWAHYIEDGPITWPGSIDPFHIYREAAERDPWPENDDGDLQFGTSVRAGAKYLLASGRISEYRWAWTLEPIVTALLATGPVVIGSSWYRDMFEPDSNGVIDLIGGRSNYVGGHAYVFNGVNVNTGMLRGKNSWSRDWGNKGHFYISFADFQRLLDDGAEACLAVEPTEQ